MTTKYMYLKGVVKSALTANDPAHNWYLQTVYDMVIIDNAIYVSYEAAFGSNPAANYYTYYIAKIENIDGTISTNASWYTDATQPMLKLATDSNKNYLYVLTSQYISQVHLYDNIPEEIYSGSVYNQNFITRDVNDYYTGAMAITGTTIYIGVQTPGYVFTKVRTFDSTYGNQGTLYGDGQLNENIYDVAADATYLYVSLNQSGIARINLATGAVEKTWTNVFKPMYMKIFDGYLYGFDINNSVIHIINLTDGTISNSSLGTKYTPMAFYLNSADTYTYAYNNNNGYIIKISPNPLCFHENTKILTNNGYVTISNLRKGDLIQTHFHGFVPIKSIGYSKLYNDTMNVRKKACLYKYSSTKHPELFEDLIITGSHSVLIDNLTDEEEQNIILNNIEVKKIDGKYRLMSFLDKRSEQYNIEKVHNVWHFALEHSDESAQYGVYANGMLVETTSIQSMNNFCYAAPTDVDAAELLLLETNNTYLVV